MLMERVWGYRRSLDLETRTLDVHISRLRAKLGSAASNIITVRSVGYRMNVVPEWLSQ
jgi:DNA-binding response OmpR family regulator